MNSLWHSFVHAFVLFLRLLHLNPPSSPVSIMTTRKKVCVIGAGPSGMAVLSELDHSSLDVTCYEKQHQPGGLWNYNWRTGLTEYGEPVHNSQYRGLFSNSPKECIEFPEYSFEEHFGKVIPSFPPRTVLFDYLQGWWRKRGVDQSKIHFLHSVTSIWYDGSQFVVTVRDLANDQENVGVFDYCIVAVGHFSTPNTPEFPGMSTFPGRIIHSHDFRNAGEFAGLRVLTVGNSYSGEDMALQTLKFGAKSVTVSYRTKGTGFNWPDGITEKPLVERIEGSMVHFGDGSCEEVDAMILATGYKVHLPFMEQSLRLECGTVLNVPDLYRGVLWSPEHGERTGGRLFYVGMQDQVLTFTMFQLQAKWIARVISGEIVPPSIEEQQVDIRKWLDRNSTLVDAASMINCQTEYVELLAEETGYHGNLDAREAWFGWVESKTDVASYRDKSYKSIVTGKMSPVHPVPWMKLMDDSIKAYVNPEMI